MEHFGSTASALKHIPQSVPFTFNYFVFKISYQNWAKYKHFLNRFLSIINILYKLEYLSLEL